MKKGRDPIRASAKTRVCIIRHGETDWNRERRIQGQIDIPLNETGQAQAMAMSFDVAQHQDAFSAIYSSDLSRARVTAEALARRSELEVTCKPQLRERHYGIFQGVVKDEAQAQLPEAYALYERRDLDYDFENGESLSSFSRRVHEIFEWIARHHQQQNVAVVCHAGLLDVMYRSATARPLDTARDFDIPNCALNWFHYDAGHWHLDAWDDHHYLSQVITESVE